MKNILAIQSHVVYGHAGNSAAEFPMRRLGANVWPLNTVQPKLCKALPPLINYTPVMPY